MSDIPTKLLHKISGKIIVLLIGILVLSVLLRFYHIDKWIYFGMDQEYEAFLAKNIITGKHFPLIGVNASDTGLYLGPAFIYFASIPFALFKGDPLGWAITAAVIGVFVTYLIYKIGKSMFSEPVGIFAALFYAGSFLTSFYDRQFWNPMLVPLFSLLIGYLLFKLLNNKPKSLIWLALLFGVAVQSHLSILIFIPLILYVVWKKRRGISKKIIILSIGIFLLTQLPLIIFDIRHNFTNTKAALSLITKIKTNNIVSSTWIERNTIFVSSLGRFFWIPAPADLFAQSGQCKELLPFKRDSYPEGFILILAGLVIFFGWYLTEVKKNKRLVRPNVSNATAVVAGIFTATFIFVEFYNRVFFEYYLLFFFPWLAIALGKSMELIRRRRAGNLIIIPIIILFISLNLFTLFSSFYSYSYSDKRSAVNFVKNNLGNQTYILEAVGECPRFGGYRYLFEYLDTVPIRSYMDSYLSWLYPDKTVTDKQPDKIILLSLIDSRNTAETIAKWEKVKLQYLNDYRLNAEGWFGKIQVLVLTQK